MQKISQNSKNCLAFEIFCSL